MSQDYDSLDSKLSAAVAAAAFAICSLEETEARYRRKKSEVYDRATTMIKSRKEESTTGSRQATRLPSSNEMKSPGETSIGKTVEQDRRAYENAFPRRRPDHSSSANQTMAPTNAEPRQKGKVYPRADNWEKIRMQKIDKRYEKMKSKILAWENEKKMQAKLSMERKQGELELRRARILQQFQIKVARIDQIVGGARTQIEERRKNEESEVKEKSKKIRSTGKVPAKCFCF